MKKLIHSIALASSSALCLFLVSCAGSIDTTALVPTSVSASHRTGQPISAVVSGGAESGNMLALVSNQEFKQALESSLVKSQIFKNSGAGGYEINAFITSVQQPMFGVSMQVNMEVSYTLKRGSSDVWHKSVRSTYTAPIGEALVGAVRVRKATEGAIRENISALIRELDQKRP